MSIQNKELTISKALAVCAELTNTTFSPTAFDVLLDDLLPYETQAVLTALNRCRRELTGRLTLAAILQHLPLHLPSADEVWGQLVESMKFDELTVVVPEIAQIAAGQGAISLLQNGDKTGARMAFKQAYERLADELLANAQPVQWTVSAGTDHENRERAIMQAVREGKISQKQAMICLPEPHEHTALLTNEVAMLSAPSLNDKEIEDNRKNADAMLKILNDSIQKKTQEQMIQEQEDQAREQAKREQEDKIKEQHIQAAKLHNKKKLIQAAQLRNKKKLMRRAA